jgi:hypothetical protein
MSVSGDWSVFFNPSGDCAHSDDVVVSIYFQTSQSFASVQEDPLTERFGISQGFTLSLPFIWGRDKSPRLTVPSSSLDGGDHSLSLLSGSTILIAGIALAAVVVGLVASILVFRLVCKRRPQHEEYSTASNSKGDELIETRTYDEGSHLLTYENAIYEDDRGAGSRRPTEVEILE